jgi:amidase
MVKLDQDKYVVEFDEAAAPAVEIEPGDEVEAGVLNWCFGEVDERPETWARATRTPRCPAAGPIGVKGAAPGDTLGVTILDIVPKHPGWMVMRHGCGPLGQMVSEIKIAKVDLRDGACILPGGLRVPQHPMLGVIGTTPRGHAIPTLWGGDHGGNMDTREIMAGAVVELPVFCPGALVAFGDTHAAMGDGELSGSGVECGSTVRMRVDLIRAAGLSRPRVRTPDGRITISTSADIREAIREATSDMVEWLRETDGLAFHEAVFLVGAAASVRFSQVVNAPGPTVKVMLRNDRRIL